MGPVLLSEVIGALLVIGMVVAIVAVIARGVSRRSRN
jgi:hypothetical protein